LSPNPSANRCHARFPANEPAREPARPAATCAALVSLAALLLLAGCGYHVAGRATQIPAGVQTIAVPAFVNRTSDYRIEQRLTDAVEHEFLARTRYRIVARPESADAVLHGEVSSIESTVMVFDTSTGRATTMLVTVKLKVHLDDRAGRALYTNDNFLFREPYEISTDVPSFFQEEGPALDRMSRDFAMRLVSDILENF
jgi:outer membrane lipopolysaccharide assembly protein LptE/RlpB